MREVPLRIALLTHSVNPRGGVVHTLELARALHDAGHAVTVFVPAAVGQRLFRSVPFAVERVPVETATVDVAQMVAARIAAFESHLAHHPGLARFNVFHAQDPIGANALANLQDRCSISGFVRTVHHLDHFADARLMAWQQRGFERAERVLCVSRLWCEVLSRDHGVEAVQVRNGVDCDRYRRQPQPGDAAIAQCLGLRVGAANGEPVLLAIGGVEERKNTLRIFHAFLQARKRWPRAQLVVAGGASLLDHGAYAQAFADVVAVAGIASGPGESLLLTGTLPDDAMPALFRQADVLVTPSLCEGFGLVVLEALASGTPVVASRIAPFTEYLGDGDCCWADPHDIGSIAEAMGHALAPERVAALASTPQVCLRFNWPDSARRHVAIYRARMPTQTRTPAPQTEETLPCL